MLRALLLVLLLASPAAAQTTDVSGAVAVEVLPGWRGADGVHVAALHVRLAPGWKTYWRNAGAAGLAPQMDWRSSRNLRSVTPRWPAPTIWGPPEARSIGYEDGFVLPLLVPAAGPGPVELRGVLDIGVCRDVCVPVRLRVGADLPAGGGVDPAIAAALDRQPRSVAAPARCAMRPVPGGLELRAAVAIPPLGPGEAAVVELADPRAWAAAAEVERRGGQLHLAAQIRGRGGRPVAVDRAGVRITVIGPDRAVEVRGCTG